MSHYSDETIAEHLLGEENTHTRKFLIYFEYPDGTEDSLTIYGPSIDSVRISVEEEMERRGATYLTSEEIT